MPEEKEFEERVVQVRRVTKVVKGGKRMGFRVLSVVGDRGGLVGMGIGKASEVSAAIRKGVDLAKKSLVKVPMISGTIPHEVVGKLGSSTVLLRPAPSGKGVIAGGSVRIILELAGVKDVVAKSIGSSNAINTAKATLDALSLLKTQEQQELLRGKSINVRYVQNV
ncbi:30S ribosomal protein S5 [Candidatus Saganbacteria bacterium]|nr:30S ribosomal protein S5 [Candidatus Saganbacteria bacterium]